VAGALAAESRPGRPWLAALLVLAVAPRLLLLVETWDHVEYRPILAGTDPFRFHTTAARLAAGDWALACEAYEQGPVYPYAIAALYRAVGPVPQAVRVGQALLGVLAALLLYALAGRLLAAPFAFAAAALYALYGCAAFEEGLLLDPSLLAFLYLALALALARHGEGGGVGWLAAAGLAQGLAIGVRPNAALLLPFAAAALAFAAPTRRLRPAEWLVFAAAVALPIAPFALRNLACGEPALQLSSQGLKVFLASNLPDARGTGWAISPEADALLARPDLSAGEALAAVAQAALAQPAAFALLQLRKLHALFASYEIPNVANFYLWRQSSRWLAAFPVAIHAIAALALPGLVLARRRREARLPLLLAAGIAATILPFYVIARFRVPWVPFLCLFAGVCLEALARAAQARDGRRAAGLAAGVAVAFLVTTSPVRERIEPGSHRGLGALYQQAGRVDDAAAQYRMALAKRPGYERAAEDLVCLELERGHREAAIAVAQLHLDARPRNQHMQRLLERARHGAGSSEPPRPESPGESFSCRRLWDVDPHQRSSQSR